MTFVLPLSPTDMPAAMIARDPFLQSPESSPACIDALKSSSELECSVVSIGMTPQFRHS